MHTTFAFTDTFQDSHPLNYTAPLTSSSSQQTSDHSLLLQENERLRQRIEQLEQENLTQKRIYKKENEELMQVIAELQCKISDSAPSSPALIKVKAQEYKQRVLSALRISNKENDDQLPTFRDNSVHAYSLLKFSPNKYKK